MCYHVQVGNLFNYLTGGRVCMGSSQSLSLPLLSTEVMRWKLGCPRPIAAVPGV